MIQGRKEKKNQIYIIHCITNVEHLFLFNAVRTKIVSLSVEELLYGNSEKSVVRAIAPSKTMDANKF